jgi:DNA-binding NarL/FixJ family response regulator
LKLRIVLADDHPFVLLGIRATFSMDENLEVVGEAASAAELLSRALARQIAGIRISAGFRFFLGAIM